MAARNELFFMKNALDVNVDCLSRAVADWRLALFASSS